MKSFVIQVILWNAVPVTLSVIEGNELNDVQVPEVLWYGTIPVNLCGKSQLGTEWLGTEKSQLGTESLYQLGTS